MAFSYNKKNLANTTITGAITPTQTSVTVADATVFSYAFFYATLMPSNEMSNASNSEIVLVTNIQGNTLTLVRGQENTIARSFPYGAVITNGIYTRDIDYARSIGRKVFMARDDGTDDTNTSYQIIDPMIKNVPEEGSIITVEFDTPSYGAPTLGVNNGIGGLVQVSGTDIHITDSSGQIESVEMYGDTEQTTYSGKNLYVNSQDFGGSNWNNSASWTTDSSTYNGLVVKTRSSAWQGLSQALPVESGKTYTFSLFVKAGSARNAGLYLSHYESGAATITPTSASISVTTEWQRYSATFSVTSSGTVRPRLELFENFGTPVYICGYQLEQNSSMTPYEPYVGGTASPNPDYPQEVKTVTGEQTITVSNGQGESQVYPINLGKNLFDKDNANVLNAWAGPDYVYRGDALRTLYIPCEPNTIYTVQKENTGTNNRFMVFTTAVRPVVGAPVLNYVGTSGAEDNNSRYTITTPANARYLCVFFANSNVTTPAVEDILATIQIEKGSSATTYAPYFTPIELCKIGTYQDKIYKSGEDWYIHKEVGKQDMSALSGLSVISSGNFIASGFASTYGAVIGEMLSNIFTYSATGWERVGKFGIAASGNLWAMTGDSTITNANISTWLANKGAVVYYALATPTDTQITNATLIAQLEALYNMLPEGVADVVVTGDLPGSLTIKYYQQGTGTYTAPIVGGAEIDGGDNEQVVELDSYLPYRLVYDTNGYWRVLNKGPKVTTGAIADGAVTATKITRDNINYGTTSSDTRIGTFLGKPLWRRVEKFTNIPTGYSVHNWAAGTIANLDSIVAVNGMWIANGSTAYVPINSLPPDAVTTYGITIRDFTASSWAVVLGTGMNASNSGYIILDYTKTS